MGLGRVKSRSSGENISHLKVNTAIIDPEILSANTWRIASIHGNFTYTGHLEGPNDLKELNLEYIFIELMEIATKSVSFSFNETIYRQVDDISLGPHLSNVFKGFKQ